MMHAPMLYGYVADDRTIPLALLVQAVGDRCFYVYDLGDQFEHELVVEKVEPRDMDRPAVELLGGETMCPPEDSNGLEEKGNRSYAEFLNKYTANRASCRAAVRQIEQTASNMRDYLTGQPLPCRPLEYDLK